jgi:putative copper resistance protein D
MEWLGVAVRWLHVAAAVSLAGAVACQLLVLGPPARRAESEGRDRLAAVDRRLARLAAIALALALGTALVDLWRQVAVATGGSLRDSLAPGAALAVLADTRYGAVWLARVALLVLLGVLLGMVEDVETERDWLALRAQTLALSAASLVLLAATGHAGAAEAGLAAVAVDALHLLATALWAGALAPLALCLAAVRALPAPAARSAAAALAARFSRLGVAAVATLAVTGLFSAWQQVGGVPGLVGTAYGRWLGLKLLIFVVLLGVAASNLLVWRRRLAESPSRAQAAAVRLRRNVTIETALVAGILGVVAVLSLTTPARHDEVVWPLSFRLDWQATKALPGVQGRVAVGTQLATLGLTALLLAILVRPRRWRLASAAGAAVIVAGAAVALPPLAVDAYPTTYLRPAVPYTAASIVEGHALYRAHCEACHGVAGYGDGPAAAGLPRRPADLTAGHAGDHTAGDLFWWVTHGIAPSAMPAFADRLAPEQRWDVINFVRALGGAERARDLGVAASPRPDVAAPDFAMTSGVGEGRSLADWRGRGVVLLVLFTLPESADRLVQLNQLAGVLRFGGGEVVGVPLRDAPGVYRALGGRPVFFPIAVDGASDAATAYSLFRRDLTAEGLRPDPPAPAHMELLVDRQGYLRARWIPGDVTRDTGGWADPARLVAEIDRLARERPVAPIAAEHVH